MGKVMQQHFETTPFVEFAGIKASVCTSFLTSIRLDGLGGASADLRTELPRWQRDYLVYDFQTTINLFMNPADIQKYQEVFDELVRDLGSAFAKITVERHENTSSTFITIGVGLPYDKTEWAEERHEKVLAILLTY